MNGNTQQEPKNNMKAAFITTGVHAALLLILFMIPLAGAITPQPPVADEGIEVNLGNSDIGFGDVQPLVPGDPAPAVEEQTAPPQQQVEPANDDVEKETSERDEADAPVVNKPEKKSTPAKVPVTNPPVTKTKPSNQTVTNPKPAPPKPKAVYSGGTGTGGNNSDTYNDSRNQGVAGGKGDQGKPGGNPNSDNYNGNGGGKNGAPRVTKGDRKIVNYYTFPGDLDRATINAIVKVSPAGKGTFAGFGQGSTTQGQAYRNAISEYLRSMQFSTADHESTVTVQFVFNVKGN
jgi:outer membrane biosynthesis protein TonB